MQTHQRNQNGFHIVLLLIAVFIVAVLVVIAVRVISSQKADTEVQWAFNEQTLEWYAASGTPPQCRDPFVFDQSPIDPTFMSGVLLPGSYRGYSYKPHGGFGTPESLAGNVEINMPIDATLVGLTRYYEGDPPELQYLLTFETDCGIAFRFDHLFTLSPEFQALAEKTPEPRLNDTRTSPNDHPPRTKFKSGQVIATRVGLPSMNIYGFDFGVYDYRQRNEISKNTTWAGIHNQYQSLEWYGVCWYGMFPNVDPGTLESLSMAQVDTRKTVLKISDYCSHAPYTTLDVNQGQPTEG